MDDTPDRSQTMHGTATSVRSAYELCFTPLQDGPSAFSVPCDAAGRVCLDQLSDPVLCRYAYARSAVGREYDCPRVLPRAIT